MAIVVSWEKVANDNLLQVHDNALLCLVIYLLDLQRHSLVVKCGFDD